MEYNNSNLKISVFVFFTSICLAFFLFIQGFSQSKNEFYYLNNIDKSGDWKLNDTVKSFQGDELFYLINGGAELYIEYGFVEAKGTTPEIIELLPHENLNQFDNYKEVINGYSVTDRNQNHIYFELYKNFIFTIFDKNNSDVDLIVNSIKENINTTFKK